MFRIMMEWIMGKMKPEEKERMMKKMMEKFFASMTEEEKQKIMEQMMPKMMEGFNMMDMMSKVMPQMMSKMMDDKEMPMMKMMQEMCGKMGEGDFKPWECCPCKKLCEEGFKKKSES